MDRPPASKTEMRDILVEQVLVSDGGKIAVKSEDFIFFSLRW